VPTAEARKTRRACPTMFSVRPRPPAPLNSTRLGAYCGVAALGSGCEAEPKASRRRGAECVAFQGFLSVVNCRSPLQSLRAKPYKAKVGEIVGLASIIDAAEPYRTCTSSAGAIGRVSISSEGRGTCQRPAFSPRRERAGWPSGVIRMRATRQLCAYIAS